MSHASIMFRFPSDSAARIALDTLQELGYEPQPHGDRKLHIHVVEEDLTSALEIAQSQGGTLVEQATANEEALTSASYNLDCIPIPAHLVNEDWEARDEAGVGPESWTARAQWGQAASADGASADGASGALTALERQEEELRELDPDSGTYDGFEAR